MKPKLILCLALILSGGLSGCVTNSPPDDVGINDGFQLETKINLVEQAALDSTLPVTNWTNKPPCFVLGDALDELSRHNWLWSTNATIPPRLSKAVLTVFPSLTNASVTGSQPGVAMWCYAVKLLGETCDPAMVALLRPYLKEKSLAGDGGGSGMGITTLRFCDEAAMAIHSLLDKQPGYYGECMVIYPTYTNGVVSVISTNWQSWDWRRGEYHAWLGYDPAWKRWDKNITKLQKRLDALGLTNVTVVYSNLIYPFAVTNEALPIDPATGLLMSKVLDPDTGLPLPTEPVKKP